MKAKTSPSNGIKKRLNACLEKLRRGRGGGGQGRAGFTIIELLVTIAVFGIIALIIGTYFVFQQKRFTARSLRTNMQRNAQIAETVLNFDLRMAGAGDASVFAVRACDMANDNVELANIMSVNVANTGGMCNTIDGADPQGQTPDAVFIMYREQNAIDSALATAMPPSANTLKANFNNNGTCNNIPQDGRVIFVVDTDTGILVPVEPNNVTQTGQDCNVVFAPGQSEINNSEGLSHSFPLDSPVWTGVVAIMYKIDRVTDPKHPRLVREMIRPDTGRVTKQVVAYDIENLQVRYQTINGTTNTLDPEKDLLADFSEYSRLRKVRVIATARTPKEIVDDKNQLTGYRRRKIETSILLRNLETTAYGFSNENSCGRLTVSAADSAAACDSRVPININAMETPATAISQTVSVTIFGGMSAGAGFFTTLTGGTCIDGNGDGACDGGSTNDPLLVTTDTSGLAMIYYDAGVGQPTSGNPLVKTGSLINVGGVWTPPSVAGCAAIADNAAIDVISGAPGSLSLVSASAPDPAVLINEVHGGIADCQRAPFSDAVVCLNSCSSVPEHAQSSETNLVMQVTDACGNGVDTMPDGTPVSVSFSTPSGAGLLKDTTDSAYPGLLANTAIGGGKFEVMYQSPDIIPAGHGKVTATFTDAGGQTVTKNFNIALAPGLPHHFLYTGGKMISVSYPATDLSGVVHLDPTLAVTGLDSLSAYNILNCNLGPVGEIDFQVVDACNNPILEQASGGVSASISPSSGNSHEGPFGSITGISQVNSSTLGIRYDTATIYNDLASGHCGGPGAATINISHSGIQGYIASGDPRLPSNPAADADATITMNLSQCPDVYLAFMRLDNLSTDSSGQTGITAGCNAHAPAISGGDYEVEAGIFNGGLCSMDLSGSQKKFLFELESIPSGTTLVGDPPEPRNGAWVENYTTGIGAISSYSPPVSVQPTVVAHLNPYELLPDRYGIDPVTGNSVSAPSDQVVVRVSAWLQGFDNGAWPPSNGANPQFLIESSATSPGVSNPLGFPAPTAELQTGLKVLESDSTVRFFADSAYTQEISPNFDNLFWTNMGVLQPLDINVGEQLYVQLEDCDENRDPTAIDTSTISLWTDNWGTMSVFPPPVWDWDWETVSLTEVDPSTGSSDTDSNVFRGAIPFGIDPSTVPPNTAMSMSNDGNFTTHPGYTVYVDYWDDDSFIGDWNDRLAVTEGCRAIAAMKNSCDSWWLASDVGTGSLTSVNDFSGNSFHVCLDIPQFASYIDPADPLGNPGPDQQLAVHIGPAGLLGDEDVFIVREGASGSWWGNDMGIFSIDPNQAPGGVVPGQNYIYFTNETDVSDSPLIMGVTVQPPETGVVAFDFNYSDPATTTTPFPAGFNAACETSFLVRDNVPPAIAYSPPPADGDLVSGTITLSAIVTDKSGVNPGSVYFDLGMGPMQALQDPANPDRYYVTVNTTLYPDGPYSLTITATDLAVPFTNTGSLNAATFHIDNVPDNISFTAPLGGATLCGLVNVDIDVTTQLVQPGVSSVEYGIRSFTGVSNCGSAAMTLPGGLISNGGNPVVDTSYILDTSGLSNQSYELQATVTDLRTPATTHTACTVINVDNTLPSMVVNQPLNGTLWGGASGQSVPLNVSITEYCAQVTAVAVSVNGGMQTISLTETTPGQWNGVLDTTVLLANSTGTLTLDFIPTGNVPMPGLITTRGILVDNMAPVITSGPQLMDSDSYYSGLPPVPGAGNPDAQGTLIYDFNVDDNVPATSVPASSITVLVDITDAGNSVVYSATASSIFSPPALVDSMTMMNPGFWDTVMGTASTATKNYPNGSYNFNVTLADKLGNAATYTTTFTLNNSNFVINNVVVTMDENSPSGCSMFKVQGDVASPPFTSFVQVEVVDVDGVGIPPFIVGVPTTGGFFDTSMSAVPCVPLGPLPRPNINLKVTAMDQSWPLHGAAPTSVTALGALTLGGGVIDSSTGSNIPDTAAIMLTGVDPATNIAYQLVAASQGGNYQITSLPSNAMFTLDVMNEGASNYSGPLGGFYPLMPGPYSAYTPQPITMGVTDQIFDVLLAPPVGACQVTNVTAFVDKKKRKKVTVGATLLDSLSAPVSNFILQVYDPSGVADSGPLTQNTNGAGQISITVLYNTDGNQDGKTNSYDITLLSDPNAPPPRCSNAGAVFNFTCGPLKKGKTITCF